MDYLTTSYFTVDVESDAIESIRIVQGNYPLEIQLGNKVYENETTLSYKLYKKYYHTKKGLKLFGSQTKMYLIKKVLKMFQIILE